MAKPSHRDVGPAPRSLIAVGNLVRVAVGLALLALLRYLHIIDTGALRALLSQPYLLALAILASFANVPLESLRWHILLRSQGLTLPYARTMRILVTSLFFANFLPGAAGGDLIRGVYIYKSSQGRRTPALLSIFIDRLVGFVAFILVGLVALLARPTAAPRPVEVLVVALSILFIAALVLSVLCGPRLGQLTQRLTAGRRTRLAQIIDDTGSALRQYVRDWRSLGLALLISIVVVALAVGPIVLIAEAAALGGISKLNYAIAGLYALIANSLPATPGGLGIGETAFASACLLLDPQAAPAAYGTIFLAFRGVFILSTLPGLAAYLTAR